MLSAIFTPLHSLIFAQVFFITIGFLYLDFYPVDLTDLLVALIAGIISEYVLSWVFRPDRERWFFPGSAIAAALGIVIFFRALDPIFFAIAPFLAIASKYLFPAEDGRHVFNPSNFGIVVTAFVFFNQTTVELDQWGANAYVWILIGAIALSIAYQAKVLHTTLSFLAVYLLVFLLSWNTQSGTTLLQFTGGLLYPSLIIFASFMITDPKSSPQGWRPGIIHGVSVALMFFALGELDVPYRLFVAAFAVAVLNWGVSKWSVLASIKAKLETVSLPPNMITACVAILAFVFLFLGGAAFSSPF